MNIKDCYVRLGGKIFPWGGVRILNRLVKDSRNPEKGVALWSYELLKFGKGGFFAEVSVYGNITVRRKKDGKRVATLKSSEFHEVEVGTARVTCNGYLYDLSDVTIRGQKEASVEEQDQWAKEFDKANAGKITGIDNSTYVRVSAHLRHAKVRVISHDVAFGDTLAVTTMDGYLLSFVEHAPFSGRNVALQGFPDEAFDLLDDDDSSGW